MNYINENGDLNLALINSADYSAFHGKFQECIDPHLAKLILDDNSTYRIPDTEFVEVGGDWVTQQKTNELGELMWVMEDGVELQVPRFTPDSKNLLKKRIRLLKNGNQLEIIYHQKKGLGRFYSNEDLSLTSLARNIRNTIYAYYGWVDYDFVASHPSILAGLAVKLRIRTPCLNEWVKDKKPIIKMLSDHHSVLGKPPLLKDHIKKLINASLYGGGLKGWADGGEGEGGGIIKGNPSKNEMAMSVQNYENYNEGHSWWKKYKQEIKAITDKLMSSNQELRDIVAPTSLGLPEWRRTSKTMSYILGVFENDCLYYAYQYGLENELIKPRRVALAYDGFTTPPCEHAYQDAEFHINGVNEYIFEKTGFTIKMEVKPFENWTVQQDLIDARRNMIIADAIDAPVEGIVAVGEVAIAVQEGQDENDYSQEYLLWKTIHERTHTKIVNTNNYFKREIEIDELGNENFKGYRVFNRTDLIGAYEHEWYWRTNPETGRRKKQKYISEWIEDRNIQRKDRTDILPPPLYCPPNVLNLWKPSEYEGRQFEETDARYNSEAVDAWIYHIGIICDHDKLAEEYVLNWFAHLLQKPAEKPETCIVITGKQGTGKTIMLDPIKKIMGGGYFESSNPERDVWGNFNPMMASSMLVVLSETDKRNAFGADGKIKALKTDKELTIRNLHQAPYVIRSHHRFIIPTNHGDPVFLEEGQRRDMIIKMSLELIGNRKYFTDYAALWGIENNLISLYSYLMKRDISNWVFRDIPKTDYQKDLEGFSRPFLDIFVEWWIWNVCKKDDCDTDGYISKYGNEMYDDFKKWRDEFGGKYELNGSGDLMKKIYTSLHLPKGSLEKGMRGRKGQRTKFHLDTLRKHYKIGNWTECLIKNDDVGAVENGVVGIVWNGEEINEVVYEKMVEEKEEVEEWEEVEEEGDDVEEVEEEDLENMVAVVLGDGTKRYYKRG